jgi:hypothetical protein
VLNNGLLSLNSLESSDQLAQEPYHDERLPVYEDKPHLNFNLKRRPIADDQAWQAVRTADGCLQFAAVHSPLWHAALLPWLTLACS